MPSAQHYKFADVAVDLPVAGPFTYSIPETLSTEAAVGKRALVPFGRRTLTGYIIGLKSEVAPELAGVVKPLKEILDESPIFDKNRLKFFKWLAAYYFASLGEALSLIHPSFVNLKSKRIFTLTPEGIAALSSDSEVGAEKRELLARSAKGVTMEALKRNSSIKGLGSRIKELLEMGLIKEELPLKGKRSARLVRYLSLAGDLEISEALKTLSRSPLQRRIVEYLSTVEEAQPSEIKSASKANHGALKSLVQKGFLKESFREAESDPFDDIVPRESPPTPNKEQAGAIESIGEAVKGGGYASFLLYGVTGSGKTLVYLKALEGALKAGKRALVLVPEIALTPRTAAYLAAHFPGKVALVHSSLTEAERYYSWQRIRRGEVDVVIGTRSALFVPLEDLGLIIVDEEHETSYKQEEGVRYNARDAALMLAKTLGVTVVLGSATPSLETFHNTSTGKIGLLKLTRRVLGRPMPEIELMDMRGFKGKVFSERLTSLMGETLERGEQSLIFLNRRGFSNFLICGDCGNVPECTNCSVSLTFHKGEAKLRCHYCDLSVPAPESCASCGGGEIKSPGAGTERVAEELSELFPSARIGRLDRDTASKRGAAARLLERVDSGEIDFLIGTQMVSKGHDFPGITLVGVVSADTSLSIPDFRGTERTFQLIAQASGRAGRGEIASRVLIQTLSPEHYCFRAGHDYEAFFAEEIEERRAAGYPPFTKLCLIRLDGPSESRVIKRSMELKTIAGRIIKRGYEGKVRVLGPTEALIGRLKGRYRWQFLIKGEDARSLHGFVSELKGATEQGRPGAVAVTMDMDPITTV